MSDFEFDSALLSGGQAFVLGHPVQHSLSPDLHTAAHRFLGLDISYRRLDTVEDQLPERFAMAEKQKNVLGFSCTMPLKSAVKKFLDEQTDFAQAVGVVNTVYWRQGYDGAPKVCGHNTDVSGIVNALDWAGASEQQSIRAAIVGGGGTATSAVAALRVLGASSIDVFVRSEARAQRVKEVAERIGVLLNFYPLDSFPGHSAGYTTAVSTLPAGAADPLAEQMQTPLDGALLDVSYDPWPSAIALRWQELGGSVVSGKDMLMYQAVDQVKLFIGLSPEARLDDELQMINSMCAAIGLEERDRLPQTVASIRQLKLSERYQ